MILKLFLVVFTVKLISAQLNPNRLPSKVYPVAYDIWIDTQTVFIDELFGGRTEIELNVREATREFTLNSNGPNLNVVKLYELIDSVRIELPIEINESGVFEQVYVSLANKDTMLEVGHIYVITFDYDGWTNSAAEGLYIRRSRTSDGSQISVLTTNFVPVSARLAFPCYDEPEFKATFRLTIVHGRNYRAISNTPIEYAATVNNQTITRFEKTPPLSPHSFGFVVTDFMAMVSNQKRKYVAYYDSTHDQEEVSLALEASEKILNALESYLDTDLGVSEINDVPQFDYHNAKIGNLGLVLNDARYYYINESSSRFQHDEVIRHVSRLMAYQFFGNIITPEWWDDAWYMQGLSILFEYYILETDYPDFKSMDNLLVTLYTNLYAFTVAFREVDTPDLTRFLLTELYDWKATEMIFMIKNVLTDDVFKLALRTLLSEYRNAPVSTKLFFDILTRVGHEAGVLSTNHDFNTIMNTWLLADASPILEVSRNYETGIVTLKQDDYLNYIDYPFSEEDPIWWLPYNFITGNGGYSWSTLPNGWLEGERSKDLDFGWNLQSDEWILFNVKQTGFYHTLYDHTNWMLLAKQLSADPEKIHYINRGHLISDAFKFGYLNHTTYDVAFEMANYLNNETSTFPFRILFTEEFDTFFVNLFGAEVYSNITLFMRNKMSNMYDQVRVSRNSAELSFDELSLRASLTKFVCRMQLESCLEDAYNVFVKYYKYSDNSIFTQVALDYESDLGFTLLKYGFILANEDEFAYMFERINQGTENNVYYKIVEIIGMSQNQEYIDRLMNIMITKNGDTVFGHKINLTHEIRLLLFQALVTSNEYALDLALVYLEDIHTRFIELYGYDALYLVRTIASSITTPERFDKFLRIAKLYEIEYFEIFEYEIEIANRTIEWNAARIPEFQDVLSRLLDGRIEEPEDSEEGDGEDEDGDDDGGAISVTINLYTFIFSSMITLSVIR